CARHRGYQLARSAVPHLGCRRSRPWSCPPMEAFCSPGTRCLHIRSMCRTGAAAETHRSLTSFFPDPAAQKKARPPCDDQGFSSAFCRVGVPFACRNQAAQTIVDVKAPCTCTFAVAFDGRNQADMREAELGLIALLGDLKDNVGAVPLGFVFDEVNFGIQDMP